MRRQNAKNGFGCTYDLRFVRADKSIGTVASELNSAYRLAKSAGENYDASLFSPADSHPVRLVSLERPSDSDFNRFLLTQSLQTRNVSL